ncbi:MAG: transcription elongation factor GreA [Clostridiales bacterium]|nr:transcription elongation factor GreA [Clostridiales bacterium]
MQKEYLMTSDGLKELKEELEQLKTLGRQDIAEKIKVARSFGDLSENSEYDEAKSEQAKIEARISEIEAIMLRVRVIDDAEISTNTIGMGSKVKIKNVDTGDEFQYTIVGFAQANPAEGLISDDSPVGKALMNRKKGENVEVEAPIGTLKFKIMSISR